MAYSDFLSEVNSISKMTEQRPDYVMQSLGTLGGGNHFWECSLDENGDKWLSIHSGSRNYGLKIANWHQKKAIVIHGKMNGLEYLEGDDAKLYFEHMKNAQVFASLNRQVMAYSVIRSLELDSFALESVESVHNYIDFEQGVIRKGAISALKGERVVIPWNMRDGMIIGEGKGNPDWNNSAPHGAGRVMSRSAAKKNLSMDEFKKEMGGVWSSCISENTLDEAPMAYKDHSKIASLISPTVDVKLHLKPIYNFKAEEKKRF